MLSLKCSEDMRGLFSPYRFKRDFYEVTIIYQHGLLAPQYGVVVDVQFATGKEEQQNEIFPK
jgi:hypothetical protein